MTMKTELKDFLNEIFKFFAEHHISSKSVYSLRIITPSYCNNEITSKEELMYISMNFMSEVY